MRRRTRSLPTITVKPAHLAALLVKIRHRRDRAAVGELLTLTAMSTASMTRAERRRVRELAGLSVAQAARLAGVPRETLNLVEHWEAAAPGAALARRLDRVYGCHPAPGCKGAR